LSGLCGNAEVSVFIGDRIAVGSNIGYGYAGEWFFFNFRYDAAGYGFFLCRQRQMTKQNACQKQKALKSGHSNRFSNKE
jgi:hypothetical protein